MSKLSYGNLLGSFKKVSVNPNNPGNLTVEISKTASILSIVRSVCIKIKNERKVLLHNGISTLMLGARKTMSVITLEAEKGFLILPLTIAPSPGQILEAYYLEKGMKVSIDMLIE
jgi:hypothetical protein